MNRKITLLNRDISNRGINDIKFIVIHYVGSVSTSKNNADYFYSVYRGASAHYFVDENEIYQVVENKDISWHCGTTGKYYNNCRNQNSIGIELCCKKTANGGWYFEEGTLRNAVNLVKELLKQYPNAELCRHYDVTRKICPEPMVSNPQLWNSFIKQCKSNNQLNIQNQSYETYIINAQGVNVREKSSLDSKVLRQLGLGNEISVFSIENGFYKTDIGYVKKEFADKPKQYETYIINAQGVRVRDEPSLNNTRTLRLLGKGNEISVFGIVNGFYKTDIGYVKCEFANKRG